jgi:hypothetical protein
MGELPVSFGLTTINGLPAHILIVHAVVVLVPLTGLAMVISVLRPSLAVRWGLTVPLLAAASLVSVFAAMNAGGWLQSQVRNTALVRRHVQLGGQLWPFVTGMLVLSLIVWWTIGRDPETSRRPTTRRAGTSRAGVLVAVLTIVVSAAAIVQVVRIGEAGSRAVWHSDSGGTNATPG